MWHWCGIGYGMPCCTGRPGWLACISPPFLLQDEMPAPHLRLGVSFVLLQEDWENLAAWPGDAPTTGAGEQVSTWTKKKCHHMEQG